MKIETQREILKQFFAREEAYDGAELCMTDEQQRKSGDRLDHAVDSFEDDPEIEDIADTFFRQIQFHGR